MIPRRNRTWSECWELLEETRYASDTDGMIRRLEAYRPTEQDWLKIVALAVGFSLAAITMIGIVFWITWRALLWSMGQL